MKQITVEPYEHDCERCNFYGWMFINGKPVMIFHCDATVKSIVLRYSSLPSDYSCKTINHQISTLQYSDYNKIENWFNILKYKAKRLALDLKYNLKYENKRWW